MLPITLDMSRRDAEKLIRTLRDGKLGALGVFYVKHPELGVIEISPSTNPEMLIEIIKRFTSNTQSKGSSG
jgi:hypothetical protein